MVRSLTSKPRIT